MEQLQQRMASLGQDKEGEGQENQAQDSSVKSPGSSNDFFHETGEFQFNELRHRASKPDDEKGLFITQGKAVTAVLSVPLSSVITPFEQWLKEVGKYAVMSGKSNHQSLCYHISLVKGL